MKADANLMVASIEDSLEKIRATFTSTRLDYDKVPRTIVLNERAGSFFKSIGLKTPEEIGDFISDAHSSPEMRKAVRSEGQVTAMKKMVDECLKDWRRSNEDNRA